MAETERQKITEASAKTIKEIVKQISSQEVPPQGHQGNVTEVKKAEAKKQSQEIVLDPERVKARVRGTKKESLDIQEGQARVTKAMGKTNASEVSWLIASSTELAHSTEAMNTVSRIVEAPIDLRNDPNYLFVEGTRLYWLTQDSNLTPDARNEANTVLRRIYNQINEVKSQTPDFVVQDEVVKENILGEKQKPKIERKNKNANLGSELFGGIDTSRFSQRDQLRIREMVSVLNNQGANPESAVTMEVVRSYIGQVEYMLQRADPGQELQTAEIMARLRGQLNSYYDQDRIPSTIMLTKDEVKRIISDPIGFLEWMSQDISKIASERGFDSPILEQRLNRYKLMTDYFVSDAYNAERGLEFDPSLSMSELGAFKEQHRVLLETKGNVLDQYTDRLHALEFNYYLQQVGDFEKDTQFIRLLDKINERGAYGTRAQYGGLAEVAVQKMRSIHDALLRDPESALKERSLPEIMKTVRERTSQAMLEERALWEPHFNNYLDRLVGDQSENIPRPTIIYDKQLCDTITSVAESSYQMFFEKEAIMTRGLDPALAYKVSKDAKGIDAYETADAEEKILGTFRFRDWFLRKWNGALSGQRALWNRRALWYVHKDPALRDWASESTTKLFTELQEKAQSWKDTIKNGDSTATIKQEPLYQKLSVVFSEYEEKAELADGKDILFFSGLSRQKLYRQVACDVGGEIAQLQGARCYGYWESGPRRNVVREMIEQHPLLRLHYERGKASKNSLAVGLDLFEASRGWFFPDRLRSEGAQKKFLEVGDRALQLQPHAFFKMKHMRNEIPLGHVAAVTLEETTQRFDTIQSRLMLSGEGSIDYSKPVDSWTEGQKGIIRDVFDTVHIKNDGKEPYSLSEEQYVIQMKAYYESFVEKIHPKLLIEEVDKVTGKKIKKPLVSRFDEFAHIKYAPDFSFVLFTNDIPLAVLEHRNVLDQKHITLSRGEEIGKAVKDYHQDKVFVSVSLHSTDKKQGKGGLWRRAWSDFGTASSTIPLQNALLESDEKIFSKAVVEMRDKVKQYQGPSEGARSALEAIVGYLEAAKVKGGYTEFLKGMKNSSVMKEYWGDLAKSLALDEVSEEFDKFELLLGKLGKEAPGAEEWVKDYLGITNWRRLLGGEEGLIGKMLGEERFDKLVEKFNENTPSKLYFFKARNVAFFGIVVFMLFAIDQAKKGGEESKQK